MKNMIFSVGLALLVHGMAGAAGDHEHHMKGLVEAGDVTHTAVTTGSWSNPGTWNAGVPDDGAYVLIPDGLSVTYDANDATRLGRVRVDGELAFSTTQSSRMLVDTLFVSPGANLEIGTTTTPIPQGITVDIVIANNGDIDVMDDPSLLSRGLVSQGSVAMHGAPKTVHAKVAQDPQMNDTILAMAQVPDNWQVGDTIVLTGTRYSGWRWDNDILAVRYFGTEDEVLTITAINGANITVDRPLTYDHVSPRADLKASVANFSRNVTIATEDPGTAATHQRGHVMFMTADVDVRYVAFHELGRTDKSVPSMEVMDIGTVTPTSNARGRYAFHFHRTGISQPRNPGIAIGNAVFRSPGWGYVHHDSNAVFHNNASYDTFGAGFVAETGNEIGSWTNNIAIRAEGNSAFNPKNGNDVAEFDMGRTGDGYWFQGRMVRSVGNIAASVNHGYVYLHRGDGMIGFPYTAFSLPEALRRLGNNSPDDAPILNFHSNEAFASTVGLYVVKANPNQQHDIHSHLSDFTAWEVEAGAALEYTSHYLLENFDLVAKGNEAFNNPIFGIDFGTNTTDMVINGSTIEGFPIGIGLAKDFTDDTVPPEANQYVVIEPTFVDVAQPYADNYDPNLDLILTSAELVPGRFDVLINGGAPLTYDSPATSAGSGVSYAGTKTDSVGDSPIPAGTDAIGTPSFDMIGICEQDGYYRTTGGTPYAVVEEYFTDRATGRIEKYGLKTLLGPDVDNILGNEFHAWANAFQRGIIDLASLPPTPEDDFFETARDTEVTITPLENDTDPESEGLFVDGVVQPHHGTVFDNGDGTLLYRPDFDFEGTDSFRYWATDDQGNFTPATITVFVGGEAPVFKDGFE